MAIYLPGTAEEEHIALDELTPREIVAELDKHVIGQNGAKRAVAIALRNRMRRQKLAPDLAEELRLLATWLGLDAITVASRGDLAPALKRAI